MISSFSDILNLSYYVLLSSHHELCKSQNQRVCKQIRIIDHRDIMMPAGYHATERSLITITS